MENMKIMEKDLYKQKMIERVEKISDKEKREPLYRTIVILDNLPACECRRVADLLTEMYFS